MDALGDGLITTINGVLAIGDRITSPAAVAAVVIAGAFGWLAVVELDDLARRGVKPDIPRH